MLAMKTLWKAYFGVVSVMLVLTTLVSVSNDRSRVHPDDPPSFARRRRPPMRNIVAYSTEKRLALERHDAINCSKALHPPSPEQLNIVNDHWQVVNGTSLSTYSAHFDDRTVNHKFVRVLAMAGDDVDLPLYCQIWFDDASSRVVEAGVADMWPPHWDPGRPDNTSEPVMLTCEMAGVENASSLPTAVSIASSACGASSTLLPLDLHDADPRSDFAVCVKGMVGPDDVSLRLVEWLELNVLLGAKQFFVYVYTVHARVRKVLEFYARKGLVTLVEFSLPPGQPHRLDEIGRFLKDHRWQKRRNELIPYNDCYYRNLRASRFVIPLDLDEVIVPVRTTTWSRMFGELQDENPEAMRQYSSWTARNAFFFDFFAESGKESSGLHMLSHRTRSAQFGRGEQNGKSFISTSSALTVFNHYTLQTLTSETSRLLVLDTDVAQLNHYRGDCDEVFMDRCDEFRRQAIRDDILVKYKKMLKSNVRQRLRQLFHNSSSHIY